MLPAVRPVAPSPAALHAVPGRPRASRTLASRRRLVALTHEHEPRMSTSLSVGLIVLIEIKVLVPIADLSETMRRRHHNASTSKS